MHILKLGIDLAIIGVCVALIIVLVKMKKEDRDGGEV